MGWDAADWDETRQDGKGLNEMGGWNGMERDVMRWDGMGRGTGCNETE